MLHRGSHRGQFWAQFYFWPLWLFADDKVLYLVVKSMDNCDQLQQDLKVKCNVLRITRWCVPFVFNYTLHGCCLDEIASTKYLGVYLSKDLRWNERVKYITNKGNRLHGFLNQNLKQSTTSTKEKAYKSLIQPIVEYCSSVWDCYTTKNIN